MIVSPFAIDGRPIDNGNKTFSVCPICACAPPWAKTCEDLIAYLHILETELSGTYYNTGYIFRSLDDPLNPSYQHFLGALTFVYEGISYVAFVTCACSFVVWKWNDKYSIHEQSDACTCLADMLMAMYVTQVGGTEYGEGFMYSPPEDEGGLATKTAHGGAVIFTFGEQNYIFLRPCDKEDCLSFSIREMTEGEYYREMSGVCDCPEIIDFTLSAEFEGHTVYGESILVRFIAGIVSYKKCISCYYDTEASTWKYFGCVGCITGTVTADVRQDFACDGCVDERELILAHQAEAGVIEYQYGSHTCYKWTIDDVVSRAVVMSGANGNNGGGYVDYRWLVLLVDYEGKRWLVNYYVDDYYAKLRWDRTEVQNNTVLDGYANLLKYTRDSDGNSVEGGIDIGIPGDTYGTYLIQNPETGYFYTEAEAIAFSQTESSNPIGATSVFNYYQVDLESIDKRTPACDYGIIGNSVVHVDWGEQRWRASNIGKYGVIYSFRALETNRGFLLLDGTYVTEIYQPTLNEVQTCADFSMWEYGHSRWDEGIVREHGIGAADDPICPEVDPEEFE